MAHSSDEFAKRVTDALIADDEAALASLVSAYQPDIDMQPNERENDALVVIGKFGHSGRESRYEPFVTQLLAKGIQPDLVTCAYLCLIESAQSLVMHAPGLVNQLHRTGIRPLHAAAERGELAMVDCLLAAGADATLDDKRGELPIMRALHAGPWKSAAATEVAERLAPLCVLGDDLSFLAAAGLFEKVQEILRRDKTRVDETGARGETPLFRACHNNHPAVVRSLLDYGANPNIRTEEGETPLGTACLHRLSGECDKSIIEELLAAGAWKSLEAALILEDVEFARDYAERNPAVIAETEGLSPLYYAIHTGAARSVELLIELGARPNEQAWQHIERIFGEDAAFIERLKRAATPRR